MRKKYCTIFLAAFCIFTACSSQPKVSEIEQQLNQIEQALGDNYKKQSVTKVTDYLLTNTQGGAMVLHLCLTTCYEADPADVTGLDENAISAVFDPESAELQKAFTAGGHSAAIYHGDTRAYLCWTSSPEATGILEYDVGTVTEDEAIRIVESVYQPE